MIEPTSNIPGGRRVQTSLTRGPIPLRTEAGDGNILKDIHSFLFCRQTVGNDDDGDPAITLDQHGAVAGAFFENRANRPTWHFCMLGSVTALSSSAGYVHVREVLSDGAFASGSTAVLCKDFSGNIASSATASGAFGIVTGTASGAPVFVPLNTLRLGPVHMIVNVGGDSQGVSVATSFDNQSHPKYACLPWYWPPDHILANMLQVAKDTSTTIDVWNLGADAANSLYVGVYVQAWYAIENGQWWCSMHNHSAGLFGSPDGSRWLIAVDDVGTVSAGEIGGTW